jgi:FAD/FMN-containing dehydrogenase
VQAAGGQSYGTLGVMTEITLKVLPAPEAQATIVVHRARRGRRRACALSAGLGSPYGVSGAALLDGPDGTQAFLRIEDFAPSVAYRAGRLAEAMAAHGAARMPRPRNHAGSGGPSATGSRSAQPPTRRSGASRCGPRPGPV